MSIPIIPIKVFLPEGTLSDDEYSSILEELSRSWSKDVGYLISEPKTFKDQFKSDVTNSAYRIVAKQILNATKNFIIQSSRKLCDEESKIKALIELLDTEVGTSLLAIFIGIAVSYSPKLSSNPKMKRILKELKISGMAGIGNAASESLISNILPIVISSISGIQEIKTEEDLDRESILISDFEMDKLVMKQE